MSDNNKMYTLEQIRKWNNFVDAYEYHDKDDKPYKLKVRLKPTILEDGKIKKNFYQYIYLPEHKKYKFSQGGLKPCLYKLPEMLQGIKEGKRVFLVEGEKDVNSLRSLGEVATTSGSKDSWKPELAEHFRGASEVIILPDQDEDGGGQKYGEDARRDISKIVPLTYIVNVTKGKDITDFLQVEKLEDLEPLIEFVRNGRKKEIEKREIEKVIEEFDVEVMPGKYTPPLPPKEPKQKKKTKNVILEDTREYLNLKYELKRNIVTQKTEIYCREEKILKELTDKIFSDIYIQLQDQKIFINKQDLQMLLMSYAKEYDPLFDFFEALPDPENKNVDYIKAFTDTITLKDEAERTLFENAFEKWFVGILTGVYPSDYCNHEMLILIGEQGLLKTTLLNSLMPTELKKYIQESGNLGEDAKDIKIAMCDHLLINIDELESFNKKDVDSLKSLITTKHFDVRMPYEHYSTKLKKRASFCGSTNKDDFLRDVTGSRRFLIFEISHIDFNAIDNNLIKNMWWQAREMFKSGFKYYLSPEEVQQLNNRNERFMQDDHVRDIVLKHLKPAPVFEETGNIEFMTCTEIARYLLSEENMNDNNLGLFVRKLGAYLKKFNYIRKTTKRNGNSTYVYAVIKGKSMKSYSSWNIERTPF